LHWLRQTKEKVSPKDITGDMWSLDLEDVQKDTGAILVKTKASERKISGDKVKFHKGQVLYSKLRPYLKKILVAPDEGICTPELVPFDTYLIDENYIAYVLRSPHIDYVINSVTYGVKMPRVGTDTMTNLLIPLPPLAEQKRIVAKIEELLPYVDCYVAAYEKLEQFNAKFPEDMKKSILQYAIQGKLVEQRPEEGTGEELYQQILKEKKRLIKEGKIKKEKPLTEIAEDEIPFDIPESWKWVKVGSLAVVQSSKRVFEKDYVSDGIPFFRSKEIGDLYRNEPIKTELFIAEEHYNSLAEEYGVPQIGDILITSVGTIGNTWICDGRKFYYKDGNITQICGNQFFDSKYVECFLHSPLFEKQALSTVAGTAYSALTIIKLKNLIMPLPPLAEQKRIVAKLEEILPLCERLK
jgi:type I restriction enzyme S subunit